MTVVLQQLPHERVVVRKRAATCLGSVAVVVSEALLNRLAVHLLQKISESPPPDVVRTLIQVQPCSTAAAAAAVGCVKRCVTRWYLQCGQRNFKKGHVLFLYFYISMVTSSLFLSVSLVLRWFNSRTALIFLA